MIIAVEAISFHKNNSELQFTVSNTLGNSFGVTTDTKITLYDKDTDIEKILSFFRACHRPIAEIDFIKDDNFHLKYINFMALE